MNHHHNFFQNFESHVVLNTNNFIFLTGGRTKCRRTKCQNMLRWSGQNPIQRMGRTKCQPQKKSGQNANLYLLPNWVYSYGKTHWIAKPKVGSMAKPTVLYRAQSYCKTHWGIHGKSHGTKIISLNFGWQQHQYTFRGAIMIFWRLIHISL